MYTNKRLTIKHASIAFDTFINEGGVGAAMFFVLLELIAVNTSSLWYVFGSAWYNVIWACIGALGFSIVTTVVIRKKVNLWLKFSFPVFDMMLVFTGMSINHWGHMFDNPFRLIITIIFSLFTGAVLVALGLINYEEQKSESNYKLLRDSNVDLKSKLLLEKETSSILESELSELQSKYDNLHLQHELLECNLSEQEEFQKLLSSDKKSLTEQVKLLEGERDVLKSNSLLFETYKEAYYLKERARLKKMKRHNWKSEEVEVFEYSEKYVKEVEK